MFLVIQKLLKIGLITPIGLARLLSSFAVEGTNLAALLRFAARKYADKIAVTDDRETISYRDLYFQTQNLAAHLQEKFGVKAGDKIAFLCRSSADFVRAVCAASRIGGRVFLLNPEMTDEQFAVLSEKHKFDFLFYDAEVEKIIGETWNNKSLKTRGEEKLSAIRSEQKIKLAFSGEIIVLTGGTTGTPKTARRKPSVFNFLNPFFALLTQLDLDDHQTVYIATPAYHGFGIAAIIIGIILGETMFLLPRFDAAKGCELIEKHKIEVVTVVPLMLQRMIDADPAKLDSLKCIISGGAAIDPVLVEETLERFGDKLFNLYGTSEAGFSVIAKPEDLRSAPETIGREIAGVKLRIFDENEREVSSGKVGKICIKSAWSVASEKSFIETGDLGLRDESGLLFLRGRNDEMIVSGGENVYPIELENILVKHPAIRQIAVIGVPDKDFGQRLKAFVVLKNNTEITETEIKNWLETRIARFQMPREIKFLEELPTTAIGKINKKVLQ